MTCCDCQLDLGHAVALADWLGKTLDELFRVNSGSSNNKED